MSDLMFENCRWKDYLLSAVILGCIIVFPIVIFELLTVIFLLFNNIFRFSRVERDAVDSVLCIPKVNSRLGLFLKFLLRLFLFF